MYMYIYLQYRGGFLLLTFIIVLFDKYLSRLFISCTLHVVQAALFKSHGIVYVAVLGHVTSTSRYFRIEKEGKHRQGRIYVSVVTDWQFLDRRLLIVEVELVDIDTIVLPSLRREYFLLLMSVRNILQISLCLFCFWSRHVDHLCVALKWR